LRKIYKEADTDPEIPSDSKQCSTRERCKLIKDLGPDGIIHWSIVYPANVWKGGNIGQVDFLSLLADGVSSQAWPPQVHDVLLSLKQELGGYLGFKTLLNHATENKNSASPKGSPTNALLDTTNYVEFRGLRRDKLDVLPSSMQSGVKASKHWQEESRTDATVTEAIRLYMPMVPECDAVFIVKVGFREGWDLFERCGFGESVDVGSS